MGFFSTSNEVIGKCFVCNQDVTKVRATGAYGHLLSDNSCICEICRTQKQLDIKKDSTKDKFLQQISENGFILPSEFIPTKRIKTLGFLLGTSVELPESFLEIDEQRKLMNMPEKKTAFLSKDKRIERIRKFIDLIDFELLNNGNKLIDGHSLLGSAVGGIAFGGVGAIVGAAIPKKSIKDVCNNLSIKVVFNDMQNPIEYINIITSATKTNSKEYTESFKSAQECLSILAVILKQNQEQSIIANSQPQLSAADEIKKFKELLDMGAITEDEFITKKKQLLEI